MAEAASTPPTPPTPPAAAAPAAPPAPTALATPPPADPPAAPAAPVIPEKYDLKLPDGAHLDASAIEAVSAQAKALKLTNEQAQALLTEQDKAVAQYAAKQQAEWAEQGQKWVAEIKADPEIGGATFDASISKAKQAVEKFGTPAFREALESTGLGNHPEVVRVFARIGRAMSEDKLVTGAGSSGAQRDPASVLYGG